MTDRLNTAKKKGISLPQDLLEQGLERSREENRTFSSYIANLIARDLKGQLPVPRAAAPTAQEGEEVSNAA